MRYIANPGTGKVHTSDCCYAAASFEVEGYAELYEALACGYEEAGCCLTDRAISVARQSRQLVGAAQYNIHGKQCCICGHNRRVERAHIVPRHAGGSRTAPLCPNCHQAFDFGQLNSHEMQRLVAYCSKNLGMGKQVVQNAHGWGRAAV